MQCCHILFFLLLQRTTPILPTAPSSWARNHSSPHTFLPQVVSPCKSVLDVQANASGVSLLFSNKGVWIYMFSCYNQYSTDQLTPRTFANVLRQHLAAEVALLTAMTQMQPFIPATKALQYSTKPKGSLLRQYCGMCADKEGKETKQEARTLSRFLQSSFHKLKFLNSCKSCMTNWHATKIASRDTGCAVKTVIRHNRHVGLSSERGASTT